MYERVDTRLFKAFMAAAELGSFTHSAVQIGMTQSGMSQHISKLEEQLGVPLFERVNKKVILTSAGRSLKGFIEESSETMAAFMEKLVRDKTQPQGVVRYGMPAFCLKTPHFPMLLKMREAFPAIRLHVNLWANEEIHESLLAGEIDFGFVTRREDNPALQYTPFAEEEYLLVSKEKKTVESVTSKNVGELPYVSYPGFGALFQIWREHFFPQREMVTEFSVPLHGFINNLDGALTMVRHGVGSTIVPRHCVVELLKNKEIFECKTAHSGKGNPRGTIHIVTRIHQTPPRRVQLVIDSFMKMKKDRP